MGRRGKENGGRMAAVLFALLLLFWLGRWWPGYWSSSRNVLRSAASSTAET